MRRLKAQQIVEFMLAAPLLILFFAILTEFAYSFNIHLVLSNAVKSSVSAYLNTIKADSTEDDYKYAVNNYILNDLQKNKIPNAGSTVTQVITVDKYPAVVGSYTYNPGFGFAFLPALRTIHMDTITVFPFEVPDTSGYENGISTDELDTIQPYWRPQG